MLTAKSQDRGKKDLPKLMQLGSFDYASVTALPKDDGRPLLKANPPPCRARVYKCESNGVFDKR